MTDKQAPAEKKAALYTGFFWMEAADALPPEALLFNLTISEIERIEKLAVPHLNKLAPHGWVPGTPNRTLLLYHRSLRIVYGGSMGPEIGVTGLTESQPTGFFLSRELVQLLSELERSRSEDSEQ